MTDLTNGEVLCTYGMKDAKYKCINLRINMTVDSTAKLAKCDYSKQDKCKYLDNNNVTSTRDCGCALNDEGSSWCPASSNESKIIYFYLF